MLKVIFIAIALAMTLLYLFKIEKKFSLMACILAVTNVILIYWLEQSHILVNYEYWLKHLM